MTSRTISCRIPQQLFEAVQRICKEKKLTLTDAITIALNKLCQDKISLAPVTEKVAYCPICGFTLYAIFPEKKRHIL